jgi:DNA-binding NarL/FixJ family response regulator
MRVLLADDQSKVRSALRLLLEQEPGMSVVAVKLGHILALASGALRSRATTMAAYLEDARG